MIIKIFTKQHKTTTKQHKTTQNNTKQHKHLIFNDQWSLATRSTIALIFVEFISPFCYSILRGQWLTMLNMLTMLTMYWYFDIVFFSQLGNEDNNLSCYELQISAKDYCFGRKNQLIGVAVLPIRDINNTGSFASWFALGRSLFITENGWAILRILSQRSNDELARDFVMLKFDRRMDNDLISNAS